MSRQPGTDAAGTSFVRVDVTLDTAAWLTERRRSLGASDVPAVLGVSPYATPLDVYYAKHGIDRPLDPELAFIGHAEELTVGRWLRRFRPDVGILRRGYMARSIGAPWLHASFDRFVVKRGVWRPVQIKTAHHHAGQEWADGVPIAVQTQIQTELYVHGADYGYAVAFVGGRNFHLHRVDRDDTFIRDVLLPDTEAFWQGNVEAHIPPPPTSTAETVALWPGDPTLDPAVADGDLLDLVDRYRAAKDAADVHTAAVDRLRLDIQTRMGDATELVHPDGRVLATWRPQQASEYTVRRKAGRRFTLKDLTS